MSTKPVCVSDFEEYAFKTLDRNALDYYRSGANYQETLRDNVQAFKRYKLRPRVLRDVSNVDLTTTIQGHEISMPICMSPTAMNRLAHPDGEVAVAKAAEKQGTCYTLSSSATSTIEEVAEATPSGYKWFQLYVYRDRDVSLNLVKRAEKAGFKALLLTVDCQIWGRHLYDAREHFKLPPHLRMSLFDDEVKGDDQTMTEGLSGSKDMTEFMTELFDPSLTWNDVRWLKRSTSLPVIVKGILTREDAEEALKAGVDGIFVSNHGGRQLDGVPATIDVVPEILDVVGGQCEVYMDGGIRSGIDVMKALAMGVRAVFIGRPYLWGLVYDGEDGVYQVLQLLKEELRIAMALTGASNVSKIDRSMVVHQSYYERRGKKDSKL